MRIWNWKKDNQDRHWPGEPNLCWSWSLPLWRCACGERDMAHAQIREHVCVTVYACIHVFKLCVCVCSCASALILLIQGGHLHRASRREREWKGVGGEGDINSAGWFGHYPLQRQTLCKFPVMLAVYGSSQHCLLTLMYTYIFTCSHIHNHYTPAHIFLQFSFISFP